MKKRITATLVSLMATTTIYAGGTDAGTDISNSATLEYSAGGVKQNDVQTATPDTFKVDKKVDMVLTTTDTDQIEVTPGQKDRITNYEFKNEGNANQYFKFTASNLTNDKEADYDTDKDNQDVDNLEIKCEYTKPDGSTATADWAPSFTIEIKKDTTATCQVRADIKAPGTAQDKDIMNVELLSTAVTDSTGNTDENESNTESADTVDVVLADGVADGTLGSSDSGKGDTAKDGKEAARSGYIVVTPVLSVTKTSCVVSDPVNGTSTPKRIPGAIIRYMFDIKNTGTGDVSDLNITDDIQSELLLDNTKASAKKDENKASCSCATEPQTSISGDTTVTGQEVKITKINVEHGSTQTTAGENHTCVSIETEIK